MAYGLKYKAEWQNTKGQYYRLRVYQRDYTGSSKTIGYLAGCVLEVQGNMGDIITPIIKTQLRFTIIDAADKAATSSTKYGDWQEFFTPDATLYKVVLGQSTNSGSSYTDIWSGYVTPDSWQEDLGYRGAITITARDNIGHLKDFTFEATGTAAPDENGLVSVDAIIQKALEVIEFPMTLTWGEEIPFGNGVYILTGAMVCAELFEGMNWYDVLEQTLEAIGFVLRFVGSNTFTVCSLRDVPNLGEYRATTGTQALEFYGGTLELDPAVKKIEEEQDYKQKADVNFEVFRGMTFNSRTTYRCKTDGNQLPGGGVVYVPEHDADKNNVASKGQTGWDVGSGMLDPSAYDPDSFLRRAEGEEGWRNYAFIASNQVLNGSSPVATYRFKTRTAAIKTTFRFTPNATTIRNSGTEAGRMQGPHYALASIKYYVMYTNGTTTMYWNGGQWSNTASLLEKEYDAQNEYATDLEISTAECPDVNPGTFVVEFAQITYKMWYDGGHGCYARVSEIIAEIESTTTLKSNKVTTINNQAYNVQLSRKPLFGALSREMGFVSPKNYLAGIFYYEYLGAAPELFPYNVNFHEDDPLVPLPVIIHEQILCYYYGAARVLSGACAPTGNALFAFNKIATYKGHNYLFQGGTLDLFSGIINSACFREYAEFNDLWSGGAPTYDEETIYN